MKSSAWLSTPCHKRICTWLSRDDLSIKNVANPGGEERHNKSVNVNLHSFGTSIRLSYPSANISRISCGRQSLRSWSDSSSGVAWRIVAILDWKNLPDKQTFLTVHWDLSINAATSALRSRWHWHRESCIKAGAKREVRQLLGKGALSIITMVRRLDNKTGAWLFTGPLSWMRSNIRNERLGVVDRKSIKLLYLHAHMCSDKRVKFGAEILNGPRMPVQDRACNLGVLIFLASMSPKSPGCWLISRLWSSGRDTLLFLESSCASQDSHTLASVNRSKSGKNSSGEPDKLREGNEGAMRSRNGQVLDRWTAWSRRRTKARRTNSGERPKLNDIMCSRVAVTVAQRFGVQVATSERCLHTKATLRVVSRGSPNRISPEEARNKISAQTSLGISSVLKLGLGSGIQTSTSSACSSTAEAGRSLQNV